MRLVFFDLETGGLDWNRHPIIQIAAIAVDEQLNELGTFEAKVDFDLAAADADALAKNSYDREAWNRESLGASEACARFSGFLKRFADVRMVSQRTGNPYNVAQLVGHNAASFDSPFLQAFFQKQGAFLPASYRVMCTLQRAIWYFHERPDIVPPTEFKLGTLCDALGIVLENAHDALADVRATVALYRCLVGKAS